MCSWPEYLYIKWQNILPSLVPCRIFALTELFSHLGAFFFNFLYGKNTFCLIFFLALINGAKYLFFGDQWPLRDFGGQSIILPMIVSLDLKTGYKFNNNWTLLQLKNLNHMFLEYMLKINTVKCLTSAP